MSEEKVLIIDDDPLITQVIKDTLKKAGFTAIILHDPDEALNVVQDLRPDIIVVDRVMPNIDGCDLCRQLRENYFTSHLPILMLTSRTGTVDKIAGLEAGADDYLCKPFEPLEQIVYSKKGLQIQSAA